MPDQEPDIEEEDEYENQHEGLQEDSDDDIQVAQNLGQDSDPIGTNRVLSPTEEDDGHDHNVSRIEHVRNAQEFIAEISQATYHNSKLDESTIFRLENPLENLVDISDPDGRLSLDLFISCGNASEETYNGVRRSILTRFPDTGVLSYYMVKKYVADWCLHNFGRHVY